MPRHPLDPLSLAAGLGFFVFGLAGLAEWLDLREVDENWLVPIAFVLLGVMLLASVVSRAGGRGALGPPPAVADAGRAPSGDDARDRLDDPPPGPGTDGPPAV
jgi:hypothetical protein